MKLFVVLFCYIFSPCSIFADNEFDSLWHEYKKRYNRSYLDEEDARRRTHFEENARLIKQHNLKADEGLHSFRLDMNHMSDMAPDEVATYVKCITNNHRTDFATVVGAVSTKLSIPRHVDWRKHNALTPVKDQGACGACWAFATTGAVEAHMKRKTGRLVSLSEQNLVDCAGPYGAAGCKGGSLEVGFEYIKGNHGINTEKSYPYTSKDGKCQFNRWNVGATIRNFVAIHKSEKDIQTAVATIGPVSTSIDSSGQEFMHYRSGIYSSAKCNSSAENHAVLITGYGEENGQKYWLIKNSWGTTWGQRGYMKIKRNAPFMCGIGKEAVYPII